MKRLILIICILSLVLLCSCSKKEVSEGTSPAPTSDTTTTNPLTVRVTFPEGYNVVQMAQELEESNVCSAAEFIALTNNREYILSLGYTFTSYIQEADRAFLLEGYLFPDTYEFYKNSSPQTVLEKILRNTSSRLTGAYILRAEELGYSLDEIITLASIIQQEAYTEESMALISSVIHNRIESPSYGKLQCDVTIHYVNDYITASPYLTGDTEKYKELYNTYKCVGLPEGPITCPGAAAIEAALYPEESNYFFFVTDEDWNYYFNESYSKHLEKCREIGLID